jgi:chromosome segregation ATPase
LDTGVGRLPFGVEAGKIDQILSSKPKNVGLFYEDADGINAIL